LRNTAVLRAAATAPSPIVDGADLPAEIAAAQPPRLSGAAPAASVPASGAAPAGGEGAPGEREELLRALEASSWNVARTALQLGVSRMTLYRRIHRLGIERS
jgi:transcriptional regulator of acetoin/glycerol metabolism